MRARSAGVLVLVASLALLVQGCKINPASYTYRGQFPPIALSTEFAVTTLSFKRPTNFTAGTLQVSGQITPQPAGPLPPLVKLIVRRKNSAGRILATQTFTLAVQSTGAIPTQRFRVVGTQLNVGDGLAFSVSPVGRDLPFSDLRLDFSYRGA
jgi:hypothetical protein